MNRLLVLAALGIGGLMVLAAISPLLIRLLHAAVPVVLAAGVVVLLIRLANRL